MSELSLPLRVIIKYQIRILSMLITICDPIQQKVHLVYFWKIEIFALSNRRFNKLPNDTKFVKIEVILLKVQLLQSVHFLLFSLYFTHYFVHYLRMNLVNKMSLLLYWVTFVCLQLSYSHSLYFLPSFVGCFTRKLQMPTNAGGLLDLIAWL